MRTRIAILVGLLAGLHLVLLFAGFFAPCDPTAQNRELPYAPPTRLHLRTAGIPLTTLCLCLDECARR